MNILITTLSAISSSPIPQYTYNTSDEGVINGYFSSEAPAKYLIRKLYHCRYVTFDKIIVLSTGKCKDIIHTKRTSKVRHIKWKKRFSSSLIWRKNIAETPFYKKRKKKKVKNVDGLTTESYFQQIILEEMKQLLPEKKYSDLQNNSQLFTFINTDEENQNALLENIQRQTQNEVEANIYVDFTGGSRVQSLMAIMIMGWLEALNYSVECAVYANINNHPNTIDDITATYKLINAVIANSKKYDKNFQGVTEDQDIISLNYNLSDIRQKSEARRKMKRIAEPYPGDEPYIFLSYAHKDNLPAQAILKHLIQDNYRVWYDEEIRAGEEWEPYILNHLKKSEFVLVLLSNKYIYESTYCAKEMEYLLKKDSSKICIIRLEDIDENNFPPEFKSLKDHYKKVQFIDFEPVRLTDFYTKLTNTLLEKASLCQK